METVHVESTTMTGSTEIFANDNRVLWGRTMEQALVTVLSAIQTEAGITVDLI
jgi:hypothetical protein